ncbi:MAG: hypothetical protein AAGC74_05680 [Verrucomicrobiota bacterium]
MNQEEKILLYWSGEADESVSREVEALLEKDEKVREYFEELGELAVSLRDEEVPERSEGLLDKVFEVEDRVVAFPLRLVWGAVAAALLVAAGLFVMKGDRQVANPPLVVEGPAVEVLNGVEEVGEKVARKPRLSERMLTDSSGFRSRRAGLVERRKDRERWEKMRFQKETI